MEEAAADDQRLRWLLDVQDAGAGGHPLRVAVGDHSPATVRVAVLERAVDDVRDRLEAPMRVPGRSLGLARRVLDLAHLIEMDERVELAEVDAGERAAHRESVTLEPARRGRHAAHGSLAGMDGIGRGNARQDGDVVDGDGWHTAIIPPMVAYATTWTAVPQ